MLDFIKHFSIENHATIHDEEALTSLQLTARILGKLNKCIEAFNKLEKDTNDHLAQQDRDIPVKVDQAVTNYINAGMFDQAISVYLNYLNERVDSLLGSVTEGTTSLDAEVIDLRTDASGETHVNAGASIRSNMYDKSRDISDANDAPSPSFIMVTGSTANTPITETGILITNHSTKGNGWYVQVWVSMYTPHMFWRVKRGGQSYSGWKLLGALPEMDTNDVPDLNNITSDSVSIVYNGCENVPETDVTGMVEVNVINRMDSDPISMQRFTSLKSGKIYVRYLLNGTWSEWKEVGLPTEIDGTGTDLNDITQHSTSFVFKMAKNSPESYSTGLLIVDVINRDDPIITQRFYTHQTGKLYTRYLLNGRWSGWQDVAEPEPTHIFFTEGDDLNDDDGSKVFYGVADTSCANIPLQANGLVCSLPFSTGSNTWVMQMWTQTNGVVAFTRVRSADGVWGDWNTLFDHRDGGDIVRKKTVVFMGDSILGNNRTETGVVAQFQKLTGYECHNFAFGGTHVDEVGDYALFSADSLLTAIKTGDWEPQREALTLMENPPDYFASTLEEMAAFDWTKADIIVFNWGTNDYNSGCGVGVYDCINDVAPDILLKYPNIRLCCMSVAERFYDREGEIYPASDYSKDNHGTLTEYFEFARDSFPYASFIDVLHIGINLCNYTNFMTDMTHHNAKGCRIIAEKLAKEVI